MLFYSYNSFVVTNVNYAVQAMNVGRLLLASNHQLSFRFLKASLFLGALSIIISLSIVCDLSLMDLIVGSLAFMPTGWGLILVSSNSKKRKRKKNKVILLKMIIF